MNGSHRDIRTRSDVKPKESALGFLVGSPSNFLNEQWNREAKIFKSGSADKFTSLLSLNDLDNILAHRNLREPYIRLTRGGRPLHEERYMRALSVQGVPLRGALDVDKVAAEFDNGATVVLDAIDHYHEPVGEFCNRLSDELKASIEAVSFITPGDVQGLTVHYDDIEVFVLQLHGTKRWTVYDQVRPLVRAGKVVSERELGAPCLETTLEPGDCLYVPWGSPHFAVSGSATSCHLSIMVRPPSWGDVLTELIGSTFETDRFLAFPARRDVDTDLLQTAIEHLAGAARSLTGRDLRSFLRTYAADQVRQALPQAGFLQQTAKRTEMSLASRVSRDKRIGYELKTLPDGHVEISIGTRTFRAPPNAHEALEKLGHVQNMPVGDLRSTLDRESLLKLVGLLVDNGVLRIL